MPGATAGSRVGRGRLTAALALIDVVITAGGQTSITFASIPGGYRSLQLVGKLRGGGSDTVVLVQFNGDTNKANYGSQQIQGAGTSVTSASFAPSNTFANLAADMPSSSRAANIASNFDMLIADYTDTTWGKTWTTLSVDSSVIKYLGGQWQWTTPAAITQITLVTQNGQAFANGLEIRLYGLN